MSSLLRLRGSNWRFITSQLTKTVLDVVLPPVCAGCGKVGVPFCNDCQAAVQWVLEPVCPCCGRPDMQGDDLCFACRRTPTKLKKIRSATLHTEPVRTVLHKLKYEGFFALAAPLADLMVAAWPRWQHGIDLILAVPLHPRRRWDRGYNQSRLLTDVLVEKLDMATADGALSRNRHTRPQIGLTIEERRANVSGAFEADPSVVRGKRIMLVDDVLTTGSTMSAAAAALVQAGALDVTGYCLTCAYKDPQADQDSIKRSHYASQLSFDPSQG